MKWITFILTMVLFVASSWNVKAGEFIQHHADTNKNHFILKEKADVISKNGIWNHNFTGVDVENKIDCEPHRREFINEGLYYYFIDRTQFIN